VVAEGHPLAGDRPTGLITGRRLNTVQRLQPAICDTPVPDIKYGTFAFPMQHLVDHALFTDADPVQVFCAGKFVCIVGQRFTCKVLNMLKNVRDNFPGNFPEIFFNAFPERY
jgi:hypothetical protein